MKKVLAIIMLFMMLIVGVGPTVGMHFCGNEFRSAQIFSKQEMKTCCAQSAEVQGAEGYSFVKNSCCETTKMQIVTDIYQTQERVMNVSNPLFSFASHWMPMLVDCRLVSDDTTTTLSKYYPPKGFDVKNEDILSFICVFRI